LKSAEGKWDIKKGEKLIKEEKPFVGCNNHNQPQHSSSFFYTSSSVRIIKYFYYILAFELSNKIQPFGIFLLQQER